MQTFYYKDKYMEVHKSIDKVPNPSDFYMHAHDVYELYYFISGDGSYIVEGTVYDLKPGDILVMRPSEAHKLQINPTKPYERVSVNFSTAIFNGLLDNTQMLRPFNQRPLGQFNQYRSEHFTPEISDIIKRQINLIADDNVRGDELHLRMVSYILPVFCELASAYDNRADLKDYTENNSIANDIIGYVNNHLFEKISLESIAERFFLSKSQINRIFKHATGSAVWEYVMIKRLLFARARIRSGDQIGEVAKLCGFNDYSSFYRAYKKRFEVSPTDDAPNK